MLRIKGLANLLSHDCHFDIDLDVSTAHCRSSSGRLRSKRFRARFVENVGTRAKKKKGNDGGRGGKRRKRLPANPTILKNCVRPRRQLLIGAVLVVLIT